MSALRMLRRVLEFATRVFPQSPAAWNGLGAVLSASGDTAEAIRCYERTLELDPANRAATRMLSRLRGTPPDHQAERSLERYATSQRMRAIGACIDGQVVRWGWTKSAALEPAPRPPSLVEQ